MNPTTSSLSWNRSKKPSLFERVFGSEDAEKRAALEREVHELTRNHHSLGKRISLIDAKIKAKEAKRMELMERAQNDPTIRHATVSEVMLLQEEIRQDTESKSIFLKMRSTNAQALTSAKRELEIVHGLLPSAHDILQMQDKISERDIGYKIWAEDFNAVYDTASNPETQVNMPVANDAVTKEIWSIWEKGDQQRLAEEEKIKHENEVMSTTRF